LEHPNYKKLTAKQIDNICQ